MAKRKILVPIIVVITSVLIVPAAMSWGFFAHKEINRIAVFTLPPELFGFYKKNIEFITIKVIELKCTL